MKVSEDWWTVIIGLGLCLLVVTKIVPVIPW